VLLKEQNLDRSGRHCGASWPYDPVVPPRVQASLAPLFVVLAFALSFSAAVWFQPFTWRIRPDVAGITVFLLSIAASAAVPAGLYALITGAFRRRPIAWDSDPVRHRFSAPWSSRQAVKMIVLGCGVGRIIPVERVPNQDRARIAQLGVSTTVFVVIAAVLLLHLLLWSMTSRPSIALSPDGLTLRRRVRRDEIRWDDLLPGGPPRPDKRNPATIDLRRSVTAPDRLSLPAGGLHIDTAFLAYTIRWYVEHPDRRARIGDAAELKELQHGFGTDDRGASG
jgi:hypothetical protein